MDYILLVNLYIRNRGNAPTYVTRNRREVIDFNIYNFNCIDYTCDRKVSETVTASDHQLIVFSIKGLEYTRVKSRNLQTTDWHSYYNDLKTWLDAVSDKFNSLVDLKSAVDSLQHAVPYTYCHNYKAISTNSPKCVPWWSIELSYLHKNCRKHFNRAKNSGDWEAYHCALTVYIKAIYKAKWHSWQLFCEGISDIPATTKVVKIMSKDKSCNLKVIRLP